METGRTCADCKQQKPRAEFWLSARHPGGLWPYCKACARIRNAAAHRARWADPTYRTRMNTAQADRKARVRAEVIEAYGGKCACCGEPEPLFLTIDHILRDGAIRRAAGERTGFAAWAKAKRDGYPSDLQLLCFNCNCGRERNDGHCPHQTVLSE